MKTKTFGSAVYMLKVFYTNRDGNLDVFTETFYNKKNARNAYNKAIARFGDDNVFIYKAKQLMFID